MDSDNENFDFTHHLHQQQQHQQQQQQQQLEFESGRCQLFEQAEEVIVRVVAAIERSQNVW